MDKKRSLVTKEQSCAFNKKKRPAPQAGLGMGLVLAYLVANGAACFACRLARGLAFAAAASLQGFLKLLSADSFDVFGHFQYPFQHRFTLIL